MNLVIFNGRRLGLSGLHSEASAIQMNFGVYENNGWRENWSGESLTGAIPLPALIVWAHEQGYLQFESAADKFFHRSNQL